MFGFSKSDKKNEGQLSDDNIKKMLQSIRLEKGNNAAQVGCRETGFMKPLIKSVADTGKIYMIDNRFDPLDIIEKEIEEKKLEGVDTLISSEISIPLDDEFLDAIFVIRFINTLRHPLKFIFELKRVLKKNGSIFMLESEGKGFRFFRSSRDKSLKKYPSSVAFRHLKKALFSQVQKRSWDQDYTIIAKKVK